MLASLALIHKFLILWYTCNIIQVSILTFVLLFITLLPTHLIHGITFPLCTFYHYIMFTGLPLLCSLYLLSIQLVHGFAFASLFIPFINTLRSQVCLCFALYTFHQYITFTGLPLLCSLYLLLTHLLHIPIFAMVFVYFYLTHFINSLCFVPCAFCEAYLTNFLISVFYQQFCVSSPYSCDHVQSLALSSSASHFLCDLMKLMRLFVEASWEDTSPGLDNSGWITLANCLPSSTLQHRPREVMRSSVWNTRKIMRDVQR